MLTKSVSIRRVCSLEELAGALVIAASGARCACCGVCIRTRTLLLEPAILRGRCCSYVHFAGEELHAQSGSATCPRPHSRHLAWPRPFPCPCHLRPCFLERSHTGSGHSACCDSGSMVDILGAKGNTEVRTGGRSPGYPPPGPPGSRGQAAERWGAGVSCECTREALRLSWR